MTQPIVFGRQRPLPPPRAPEPLMSRRAWWLRFALGTQHWPYCGGR